MKVFVYGTLRKGEENAGLLCDAPCIAEQCRTNGFLYDTGYGYPAMKTSQNSRVYGELYEVTESQLGSLDVLEGYTPGGKSNLYERIERTVFTDKGPVNAYLYIAGKDSLLGKKISNGDWKEYRLFAQPQESVLYFAYGSCMDQKRFREDGVDHYFQDLLGAGVLMNYSLRFTRRSYFDGMGRADIVEDGGKVEGKVYRVPVKTVKDYLYRREGAPNAYRPTFVEIDLDGKAAVALTFTVKNKERETVPPNWYEEEIFRGASGHLSASYISKIKAHIDALRKSN